MPTKGKKNMAKLKNRKEIGILILAAGEGTRMRPLTANIPKPLLPIAGKPFLEHTIFALKNCGFKDINILTGWRDKKLREYFNTGEKFGVNINYIEQEQRLGTAHAIGMAKGKIKTDFLSVNGDVVLTENLINGILDLYDKNNSIIMTVHRVTNPSQYGIVQIDSENRVQKIVEKPKIFSGDLANSGIYLFTPEIFPVIDNTPKSPRGEYEITDTLQVLADKKKVLSFMADMCLDVTTPWDLLAANELLMKNIKTDIKGEIEKNVTIKGPVWIGKGSVVKSGAYIIGPAIFGDDTEIGPNCLIRPSTYVGNHCKVGNACEVKNSIIMDESHVPHLNYLGDSIIGERCNLGAGTKVANLRFDDRNINIIVNGKKKDTGQRKLGVIMGDDVQTGINSSIDAGTIICEEVMIGPGAFVQGYVSPRSKIF